jgi:hypothetical protein
MFNHSKREQRLGELEERVRHVDALTPRLLFDVIAGVCVRSEIRSGPTKARIDRLIEAGASTEATLALIDLELPQWQLRRLVYEDGEWLCCLSRQPALPAGFDECAEASHEVLPVAVLSAFLQALCVVSNAPCAATTVPPVREAACTTMCCENFA